MTKRIITRPTRLAVASRPSVVSAELDADRQIRHAPTSDVQKLPENDNRYRVNPSAKFYIVQLMGEWLHIDEMAERTIRHGSGLRLVRFENQDFELRRAVDFLPFIRRFIQFGCYAHIGGKTIYSEKGMKGIVPDNFIYVASPAAWKIFERMRIRNNKKG
jgi:hypothetical protein